MESAFDSWSYYCIGTRKLKDANESSAAQHSLGITVAKHEKSEAAEAKLMRSHSKLIVFGFNECAAALQAYQVKLINLRVVVFAAKNGTGEIESCFSGRRDLTRSAEDFRKAVIKAFANL